MILFKSVKFRLTVWYAFVLAFLLFLFALLMRAELSRMLYEDANKSLLSQAEKLEDSLTSYLDGVFRGVNLADADWAVGPSGFSKPQIRLRLNEVIVNWEKTGGYLRRSTLVVRFLGFDHVPIVSNLKGWQREIIFPDFERDSTFMVKGQSFQTIHFRKQPIRLYYHLFRYQDKPLFIIQCGVSLHEVETTLQRVSLIMVILIPLAVMAACLAGWFLAKRSFKPVDMMIREAQQITAATLNGRLPRTNTGDELDRLAQTLNEMINRLESSTRAVQEFSSDVSHELKTPLAVIRGEVDLALRRERTAAELKETLQVIEGEVNELIRLVDDLMLLVRSDAKQLHFSRKKVALKELLGQVVERFQSRAIAKKIELSFIAGTDAAMEGDAVYLKRLFSNLVDNAIKFTPEGGRVQIDLKVAPQNVTVEVRDTGIGIDLQIQEKVFSRFYRSDQARAYEGAGLGLNIAKAISDAHGGILRIDSRPGEGTLVAVEFQSVPL